MFEISDFYNYCKTNQVDVIPYSGCPQPGATMCYHGEYAIFLDFSKIQSTRLLRSVCCHELGHAATGALHKVDSPFELVDRNEYRANKWATENFLTEEDFRAAFQCGCTELWQLVEYFDLPEKDIQWALDYWIHSRGVDFNK